MTFSPTHLVLVLSLSLLLIAGPAWGAPPRPDRVVLFDFEKPEDLGAWTLNMPEQDRLRLTRRFATHGGGSIVWKTPRWEPGMEQWPTWTTTPAVSDWTGYDRLMIDFTNPTDAPALIRFKAVDPEMAKTSSGLWPGASVSVPPRTSLRAVLPLDGWMGSAIDRSNITTFLFYTARAPGNYEIHLDNVTLLAPGVEPTPLPAGYVREVAEMRVARGVLPDAQRAVTEAGAAVEATADWSPRVRDWATRRLAESATTLESAAREAASDGLTIERVDALAGDVVTAGHRADRLASLLKLAEPQQEAGRGYLVGTAPGTEKVLPRDMPVPLDGSLSVSLGAARNERESFQVAVVPLDEPLKRVRLETSDLVAEGGEVLEASSLDVRVVGYVETEPPEYDTPYVGWWPDPLLDFLPAVDVAPGDAQSFWVRVRVPKDQKPGTYRGTVHVHADNAPPTPIQVQVRVYAFELPDRSPLPLAISNSDETFAYFSKYTSQDWQSLKFKYADFLASYYMTYDNLYRHGKPDMEIIEHLRDRGTLGEFNLGTLDYTILTPELGDAELQAQIDKLLTDLRESYAAAKSAGVLDHAYIYGFDEVTGPYVPLMKRVTALLSQEFPEVPLMTTALGAEWGPQSGLSDWDVWVPVLTDYKPDRADEARAAGKEVWWYTCQSPAHPYPNVFIEYPAIETRLLLGVMTFDAGAQGFLYYSTIRDEGPPREAVDSGPFTEWDPRCFSQPYNGEGYFVYPGPDGNPLASIRLENFRDGIEDYAYLAILRATVESVRTMDRETLPPSARDWLARAASLLEVPRRLVKSPYEFSLESQRLFDYRAQVAEAIESAGVEPVYPWAPVPGAVAATSGH